MANNLKSFRIKFGLNQEEVAEYLGVERSSVSHYETGEREIALPLLLKLCDLYGVELQDFSEEDPTKQKASLAFAFRTEGLASQDLKSIASFQRIVKNYLQLRALSDEQK
ncbi:MAG: helix-turn-helix domain-containing protein [Cytophagaceae bacterium]|nr:helix-turn-helix domain-containing protein [Cytophagaceae bacterium]